MLEPLSPMERRVLGVLVEKALTASVPEPLTLNSVVVGSNQKSNRDPLVNYEEPEVDETLTLLKRKGLVFMQTGGRTDRWRHNLYDAWKISKPEIALLAELLLRGPQTAAEARTRASRMENISSETYPELLRALVEKNMIVWLTPEAKRGAILTHGFHSPNELQSLKLRAAGMVHSEPIEEKRAIETTVAVLPVQQHDDSLRKELSELKEAFTRLQKIVSDLHANLGVPMPPL